MTTTPPPSTSSFSLARITRLQRTVESTRVALLGHFPRLRHRAIVCYWNLPLLSEVGFAGPRALRLWYGDSTLVWAGFGGEGGWAAPRDVLVEYDAGRPWPATVIEPRAVRLYLSAWDRLLAGSWRATDSLLAEARRAQPGSDLAFFGCFALLEAEAALRHGDQARTDSLLRVSYRLSGPSSRYWLVAACLAAGRGDRAEAVRTVRECLALAPRDSSALRLARALGLAPAP